MSPSFLPHHYVQQQQFTALTIGVFGGGQLGRMLAQSALGLGIRTVFVEDAADSPAASVGQVYTSNQLDEFINACDVCTFEFENTRLAHTQAVMATRQIRPSTDILYVSAHRIREKQMLESLGIAVAPYHIVNSLADLQHAERKLGLPLIVKTATGGYDGKGQYKVTKPEQISDAWQTLQQAGELVAEGFVNFERELSIIAVRASDGAIRYYPLAQNHHYQGILSHTIAPAPNSTHLSAQAEQTIARILNHFNYVGVLTLELFVSGNTLIANEIAPRVHNSGHWSIEGTACSQFENHMRAVAGLPLGCTAAIKPTLMVNIIGQHPNPQALLAIDGAHLHLYHKHERPGRKLGHVTILANSYAELEQYQQTLKACLPNPMAL